MVSSVLFPRLSVAITRKVLAPGISVRFGASHSTEAAGGPTSVAEPRKPRSLIQSTETTRVSSVAVPASDTTRLVDAYDRLVVGDVIVTVGRAAPMTGSSST